MAQFAFGLHAGSTGSEIGAAMTLVHQEMTGMQQRIVQLEAQLQEVKKDKRKEESGGAARRCQQ